MYQTGSTGSLSGVLDALAAFLAGVAGWTIDDLSGDSSQTTARALTFHSATGAYVLSARLGSMGGTPEVIYEYLEAQGVGSPVVRACMSRAAVPPSAYFFFADATCLFVVIAVAAGDYQVLTFQTIDQQYAWAGGAFVAGCAPTINMNSWLDGGPRDLGTWFLPGSQSGYLEVGTGWKQLSVDVGTIQSPITGQPHYTPLVPDRSYRPMVDGRAPIPYVMWLSDGAGGCWPCGVLRRCIFLNAIGLSAKQIIQVGALNYMVFPPARATWSSSYRLGILKD